MKRAFLWLVAAAIILPVLWVVLCAFRPSDEVFLDPLGWPQHLTWDNFRTALSQAHFLRGLGNSLWVTGWSTFLTTTMGAALAFALARFQVPAGPLVQAALATGLVIPLQLVVLPLFFQLKSMGLLSTHTGLILVYTASGIPYAVLLLRGFFSSLPQDLYDAARLDGCSAAQAFWSVFLPLARPGLATVALFTALSLYNEYFLAFLLLSGERQATLPLVLGRLTITSQYRADFGVLYAALVLVLIPSVLLYLMVHKVLLKGLAEGAVKG
jgi:N-acetylglucosamine transport system permease protein